MTKTMMTSPCWSPANNRDTHARPSLSLQHTVQERHGLYKKAWYPRPDYIGARHFGSRRIWRRHKRPPGQPGLHGVSDFFGFFCSSQISKIEYIYTVPKTKSHHASQLAALWIYLRPLDDSRKALCFARVLSFLTSILRSHIRPRNNPLNVYLRFRPRLNW